MSKSRLLLCAALLTVAIGPALAQNTESLAEQEYWNGQTSYLQRTLERIIEDCGAAPAFAFDRSAWWPIKDALRERGSSPNGLCETVAESVWNVCRSSPAGRAAVAAKVRSITCGYGGEATGYRLELGADGALRYDVEENRANPGDLIVAYLKSRL